MRRRFLLLCAALALGAPALAQAATISFTDASAFQAAIAGLPSGTLDFEGIAADTLLSDAGLTQPVIASPPVGVTFPASVADVLGGPDLDLEVNGLNTPGSHVLGTDDPGNFDAFIGGTSLTMNFTAPVLGFGLTVISGDTPGASLLDGDLELLAGGGTAALSLADKVFLGTANLHGGGTQNVYAYFLGVASDTPFSGASLNAGAGVPDGAFFYYLDDMVAAVPEPSTARVWLPMSGGSAAAQVRNRSNRSASSRPPRSTSDVATSSAICVSSVNSPAGPATSWSMKIPKYISRSVSVVTLLTSRSISTKSLANSEDQE